MTTNRPYLFELAALLRTARLNHEDCTSLRDVATRNGIDLDRLDRATNVIDALAAEGTDLDDWVRREYVIDGVLHGWLPAHASLDDPALTTWRLGQLAYEHHQQFTFAHHQVTQGEHRRPATPLAADGAQPPQDRGATQ